MPCTSLSRAKRAATLTCAIFLESAFITFDGKELYPTIEEKGARLGFALISNHAFVDGNKRIGMLVLLVFLAVNGKQIHPTNEEVARVGISVAAGEMKYSELLDWILEQKSLIDKRKAYGGTSSEETAIERKIK